MKKSEPFDNFPDFFWVGPQKSASTWAYRCFQEHPEIFVPSIDDQELGVGGDAIHFFNMHYYRGPDWYQKFFKDAKGNQVIGEFTPSYIRASRTPKRIHEHNPDAKILMCLRNPIERAYSHFWHEKKKKKIEFEFREFTENYDLFQNWIEPGFYTRHIKRFREYFPKDQMLIMLFDDLERDPREFIRNVYGFLDVDDSFLPSVVDKKINPAGHPQTTVWKAVQPVNNLLTFFRRIVPTDFIGTLKNRVTDPLERFVLGENPYHSGIPKPIHELLREIYKEDVRELNGLLNRDLDHWLDN